MADQCEESVENEIKPAPPSALLAARSLFILADPVDYCLMVIGFIGAAGDGFSLPVMMAIMSRLVNHLGIGPSAPNFMQAINHNSLLIVYLSAGSFVVSFLEGYCWTRTGERQASRIRARYLKAILRQDVGYFDLKIASTAEVITSVSCDTQLIQDVLSEKMPNFIMNCSTFFASYMVGFILMWRLAVVALPMVLLLMIPGVIYGRVLLGLSRRIKVEYDKAEAVAEQAISSVRTVYASVAERRILSAFSSALNCSVRFGIRQGFAKGLAFGSNGIAFAIWAFMAWYGSRLVMSHGAKGGTVFVVGASIIVGGLSLGQAMSNLKYFGEAMVAVERIKGIVERLPPIDSENRAGEEIENVEGEVEFKEVRFAYPARLDVEVFRGFNLRVQKGKTMALVGGSGSGKSTAIALLQRFYDPVEGEILMDGVDIRRLRLKWLRGKMGLVSQEPVLFATTIKENILFGKEDATVDEVVAAAKAANAHGFISQLPQQYDTQVGERGVQMSGGQKQRIAIARAIIRAPKILLLDEATSALDSESEHTVQEALDAAAVGRTTIVIAHRLSTIRNAHTISVVHSGQIIESGSHDTLITNDDSHYSALLRLQQSQSQPLDDHQSSKNSITISSGRSSDSSHSFSSRFSSMDKRGDCDGSSNQTEGKSLPSLPSVPVPSIRRLLMMNAPEWRHALWGASASVLFGGVQPIYSFALGSVIMVYFISDHREMEEKIKPYIYIFLGLSIFVLVINVIQHYNLGVMGECLTRRVRERMLSKMLTFEVGWFDQDDNSTGAVCSRLSKDASMVRSLVGDRMSLMIETTSASIVAFTMGLIIAWKLALVMIATQPIVILCFYTRKVIVENMSKKAISAQSESGKLASDAVANLRTVTAFSSQDRILGLFEFAQSAPRSQSIKLSWLAGIGLACSQAATSCLWALDFWYGGLLVYKGEITAKDLIRTFMILISTGRVIADAGSMTTDIVKGSESVASVFSILDRKSAIEPDDPDAFHGESISGVVSLLDVNFAYPTRPNHPVICGLSLTIKAGESTALVGSSGSGKSTIIGLIERFYDPVSGEIFIGEREIRSYNLHTLRRHISLVGQEPTLFTGTVRENITYGMDEEMTDMEVEAVGRAANAHDFISMMKDGYNTWCGERGVHLSGGQKQRIAIARAIIRNPSILLLDEATSALDGQSEKVVQEALERVMVGRTSVVVAHRLTTITKCDEIVVLDKGLLMEKGTHASLMSRGATGKYYGLVRLQQQGHQLEQRNQ